MSYQCVECGDDASNYCKYCDVAYCDNCESDHDHGNSSGYPDFHETD